MNSSALFLNAGCRGLPAQRCISISACEQVIDIYYWMPQAALGIDARRLTPQKL